MSATGEQDLIVVSVCCPRDCAEAVHAAFHEIDIPGTVEQPRGDKAVITAYLPASSKWAAILSALSDRLAAVRAAFPGHCIEGPAVTVLAAQDWTEAWKRDYKLLRVGRVVIKPSWLSAAPDRGEVVIELDPQMAFGSGAHSSTRLALLALQDVDLRDSVVADVGTGTGILAIAAAAFGARKVYATDFDPIAVRAARNNVMRNGVARRVEVREADLLEGLPKPLDGIVANISPDVDVRLVRTAPAYLRPGGWLILSGFTEASEPRIRAALGEGSWLLVKRRTEGEWVCLTALRPEES